MPAPVINPTTSILGWKQFQAWEFQPFASNLTLTADVWTSSSLPPGMTLDATTGRISGAITVPGIWDVGLQVDNTNGLSAPIVLPIAAEEAAGSLHFGIDLAIDVLTGLVTVDGGTASADPTAVLFSVKENDDLLLYIRFKRGDTVVDPLTLSSLKLGLKELDTGSVINIGGGTGSESPPLLVATGSGLTRTYIIACKFAGDDLIAALQNYLNDAGTAFAALAELQWVEPNSTGCGPTTLTRTSQTFRLQVVKDLISG